MDAIVAATIRHQAIGSNTPIQCNALRPSESPVERRRHQRNGSATAIQPFVRVLWGISGLFVKAAVRILWLPEPFFSGRPDQIGHADSKWPPQGKHYDKFWKKWENGVERSQTSAPNRPLRRPERKHPRQGGNRSSVLMDQTDPAGSVRDMRPASTGKDFR